MIEVIIVLVIIFIIVVLNFSSFSNASSLKGRVVDGLGKMGKFSGDIISDLGDTLSEKSVQTEIDKINLNADFWSMYQRQGNLLILYSLLKYENFKVEELNYHLKSELIKRGVQNDETLILNIEKNEGFYETCKRLRIETVFVNGCSIYPYNSTSEIKKSKVLKKYKVSNYNLEIVNDFTQEL